MITKCSICGGKLDALFPLLAQHPDHKICSACSIQKSYIVDAANRNDAKALQEAADAFMARTYVGTTDEVKADMNTIIQQFKGMLLQQQETKADSPLNELPITSGDHIDGKKVVKYCGVVGSNAAVLIAAIQPGRESSAHIARLNNHQQMLVQAKGLGANALINCSVSYTPLNSQYLLIASTADAVIME